MLLPTGGWVGGASSRKGIASNLDCIKADLLVLVEACDDSLSLILFLSWSGLSSKTVFAASAVLEAEIFWPLALMADSAVSELACCILEEPSWFSSFWGTLFFSLPVFTVFSFFSSFFATGSSLFFLLHRIVKNNNNHKSLTVQKMFNIHVSCYNYNNSHQLPFSFKINLILIVSDVFFSLSLSLFFYFHVLQKQTH